MEINARVSLDLLMLIGFIVHLKVNKKKCLTFKQNKKTKEKETLPEFVFSIISIL